MTGVRPDEAWEVLSERTVVKDRWIDLTAQRCRTPGGHELDAYYVLNYPDWAHAVAITPEGRFVLVRQWRQGARTMSVEFAGGVVDPGETPAEAAARELREETGYAGRAPEPLGAFWANPATQNNRVHVFLIRDAARVADPHLDAAEAVTVEEVDAAGLRARVRSGEMGQALHVASLAALQLHHPDCLR